MQTTSWMTWSVLCRLLVAAASTCMLTGCWRDTPPVYYTGRDYITLQRGQTLVADRDMVLATESVIQRKDQQILDLSNTLLRIQRELELLRGQHAK